MRKKQLQKRTKAHLSREDLAAVLLCICCVVALSFICPDCERYRDSHSVQADAITFTPPEKSEPPGLWDIVSEAVMKLLNGEN